jgi:WD40 repeat protein
VASGHHLHSLHTPNGYNDQIRSVAVTADGRLAVSASVEGTLRVWDVTGGVCLHTLNGHTKPVTSVAVSADGRLAVLCSTRDNTVRVSDIASGRHLHTLTGHTGPLRSVAISADGQLVISASRDNTVRVWALDWDYEFGADDSAGATATSRLD